MKREILRFDTEADWLDTRLRDITSTDCAALFNKSPYKTPYKVYQNKKRAVMGKFEPNEYMTWGTRLEGIIARGIAEDHGFEVENMGEYIRIPELRIGSSFDYRLSGTNKKTLFEIKNVSNIAFMDWWTFDDEQVLAPPHIELQVQHQLAVSGYELAYIGVLVGGNTSYLIRRERNEDIIRDIFDRTRTFWEMFDRDEAPAPDTFKDARTITELYSHCEPGKVELADESVDELARQYRDVSLKIRDLDEQKKRLKSEMLLKIQDAEKVIGSNYTISANTIAPTEVAYERKGYRNFRVNYKRGYDHMEGIKI